MVKRQQNKVGRNRTVSKQGSYARDHRSVGKTNDNVYFLDEGFFGRLLTADMNWSCLIFTIRTP